MASLAYCLKKYNISDAEAAHLRSRVDKYVQGKMTQAEAEATATKEWIKELEDERTMIVTQIQALAEEARKRHRDPWFSFDFAVKNAPKLQARIQNLAQMFTDSEAFANGDIYDGTYPIPKRGGILAARQSAKYAESEDYKNKIDSVIEEIKNHLEDTIYMYQIVTSQPRTGRFGMDYAIIEDPDLPMGEPKVTVTQAWHAASRDMYGSYNWLGGVAVREGLQNSVDAVLDAIEAKQIKKGKIDINVKRNATPVDKDYIRGDEYEVIDNGIGMDAEQIDRDFMALYATGKNREDRAGGKGVACAVILGPCKKAKWVLETKGFYHSSERIDGKKNIARVDKPRQGTRLSVESADGELFIDDDAYQYVETSELPKEIKVNFNGEKVKNPFVRRHYESHDFRINDGAKEIVKVKGVEKEIDAHSDYEIKHYKNPPDAYKNKTVIRLVFPKTGVKLTQAIVDAGGPNFSGGIILDITTAAPPRSEYYPLGQSRMTLNWDAGKPLREIIEKYTREPPPEHPPNTIYKLTDRSEWKRTLERVKNNDPEWQTFSDEMYRIWNEHKVPDYLPNKKEIEERLEDFRQNQFPFTHPNNLVVEIDKGFKGYRGGSMFHLKHMAAYEMTMRLSTAYMGGTPITRAIMMLRNPDENGSVTQASFTRALGETHLNFVMIDKTAMKSPLHFANYLNDITDHELTHNFESEHDKKFAYKEVSVSRKTTPVFPAILSMSEAVLGVSDTEVRTGDKPTVVKKVEVPVEIEKIITKIVPQEQLDLWEKQMIGMDNGHVELFTPGKKKSARQLRLFGDNVVGFHDRFVGTDATAEPGGRTQQPGTRGDGTTRTQRGDTGADDYGPKAEAEEVRKHGFSVVDYIHKVEPKFEEGRLANITDVLEEIQKEHPDFTMNDLAPWLDKLANSGKHKLGRPYLFLVKAIDPKKINFINKQGGIFGRKVQLAKIGDTYYQQVGVRETMKVPTPTITKYFDMATFYQRINRLTGEEQKQLALELGVRAVRSPSFYKALDKAIKRGRDQYNEKIYSKPEVAQMAIQASQLYGDARAFADWYNYESTENHMTGAVEDWAQGNTVVRDEIIDKMFNVPKYAAQRATRVADMGVSLDDVMRLFKGQTVMLDKEGNVTVITQSGKHLVIKAVDSVDPDQVAFQVGYGEQADFLPVVGKYQDGVIELHRDLAGNWTLNHETYHWLEDAGFITAKETDALTDHIKGLHEKGEWKTFNKDDIGGFEDRANFISWSLEMRKENEKTLVGRILQKLRDLIDSLVGFFHQTPGGIVREIETGRMFSRSPEATQAAGRPRYESAAPVFYSQMERTANELPGKGPAKQYIELLDLWATPPTALTSQISALEILKEEAKKKGEEFPPETEKTLQILRKETKRYKNKFKREELDWSGIIPWLENFEDAWKRKPTKAEILEQMEAQRIELEEVVLGEEGYDAEELDDEIEYRELEWSDAEYVEPDHAYASEETNYYYDEHALPDILEKYEVEDESELTKDQKQEAYELAEQMFEDYDAEYGTFEYHDDLIGYTIRTWGEQYEYDVFSPNGIHIGTENNLNDAQAMAFEHALDYAPEEIQEQDHRRETATRWGQYVEEGGEDYREFLITIPVREAEKHNIFTFDRSHWPNKNVVFHVRMNTRYANGKKVLFIEELQSDWHQKGFKYGYFKNSDEREARLDVAKIEEARADHEARTYLKEFAEKFYAPDGLPYNWVELVEREMSKKEKAEYEKLVKAARLATQEVTKAKNAVPDAPYRGSASWPLLAFKRMVRWGAENGFDTIAWTPGVIQVKRWQNELRKKVDKIVLEKAAGDTVQVIGKQGSRVVYEDNMPIFGTKEIQGEETDLSGVVGNVIASKFREKATGRMEFEGEDLTIGGEGFKGFYDKIMPSVVNKYFKKYKIKAGEVKLDFGDDEMWIYKGPNLTYAHARDLLNKDLENIRKNKIVVEGAGVSVDDIDLTYDTILSSMLGGQKLREIMESLAEYDVEVHRIGIAHAASALGGELEKVEAGTKTWGFDITPELRKVAMTEGFPQYAVLPDWAKELFKRTKNPEVANLAAHLPDIEANVWSKLGRYWKSRKKTVAEQRTDTTVLNRLLSIPTHYFRKIPALSRMLDAATERSDNYYHIMNRLERDENGNSRIKFIERFRKTNKIEYKKVADYLVQRDRDAYGYKVARTKAGYQLRDPEGNPIRIYNKSEDAWAAAVEHEALTLSNAGYSDMAVQAVKNFRLITHNGFNLLMGHMNRLVKQYAAQKKKLPTTPIWVEGEKVQVDLNVALAKMGDIRGYYFPRVRQPGQYTAYATDRDKDGKNKRQPHLVHFDTLTFASKWRADMEAQGYKVDVSPRKKMPEDVFQAAGNISSLSALLNKSLESMSDHKAAMKKIEVEFAKALTEQVADMIKMRGVRAHMIHRNSATGKDVWAGYEEDPAQAVSKYARGVAAGEAKKIMAFKLLRNFNGTDKSWKDFKAERIALYLRAQGQAIPEEWESQNYYDDLVGKLGNKPIKEIVKYKDYLEFIRNRRVDPINQKNAYKDGSVFMNDMLRNDEAVDRFIGNVKGVAVMWYLAGRVSAPAINLTAMVTSVPAAMKGIAGIPLRKTYGYWPRALKAWQNYEEFAGGKRSRLDPWLLKAFNHIYDNGWHKAQYNKEATEVLKDKLSRAWDNAIEFLMWGFGITEESNRIGTIAGTYMALKDKHADKWYRADDEGKLKLHEKWLEIAKNVSDDAHGVYGKANRMHFGRGADPMARAFQSFYVFKTFAHNYVLTMLDLGFKRHEIGAAAYMALSPAIIAGLGASPLLAAMFAAFKLGGADEPEEALYEWVEDNLGGRSSDLARLGFFGLAGYGTSLKGSLAINVTDIPTSIKDLAGAPGSIVQDFYYGTRNLTRGDYSKAAEKLLPKFLGAPFRAWREYHEGFTTNTNAPIFYGKNRVKLTGGEFWKRALSFNPARTAIITEKQYKERTVEAKYKRKRDDIYAKLKAYYLTPESKRNPANYVKIINEIRAYNIAVKSKEIPINQITRESIKNNLRRAFKPSKTERQRAVRE